MSGNSRAINRDESNNNGLYYQLKHGAFAPFVALVKNPENQLALCFRTDKVVIYYRNHMVWELSVSGEQPKVKISGNHARYSRDWEEIFNKIGLSEEKIEAEKKKTPADFSVLSFSGQDIRADFAKETMEPVCRMIRDFMDPALTYDYFKGMQKEKKKPSLIEKQRQQELYLNHAAFRNGYFVYDLEFAHKYTSEKEKQKDLEWMGTDGANQTDALAVWFDKSGCPGKLSWIEVKSLKSAMMGKGSGLADHLKRMDAYITLHQDYIEERVREAKEILMLYQELGLRGVPDRIEEMDFSNLSKEENQEVVILLTDEAAAYARSKSGEAWIQKKMEPYPANGGKYRICCLDELP